jgi:hypothetical protein
MAKGLGQGRGPFSGAGAERCIRRGAAAFSSDGKDMTMTAEDRGDPNCPDPNPASETMKNARRGLEQAESGDPAGAERLDRARKVDPASTDAAEQEASDGPEGQGLSR